MAGKITTTKTRTFAPAFGKCPNKEPPVQARLAQSAAARQKLRETFLEKSNG